MTAITIQRGLTPKQQRFVEEYSIDLNATQAAIRAGYSAKTAYSIGERLLRHVEVKSKIDALCADRSKNAGIETARILDEEKRIAFADPRSIVDANGAPIPLTELPADVSRFIASVKIKEHTNREGDVYRRDWEYRFWDKGRSLERLGRTKGMFLDRKEVSISRAIETIYEVIMQVAPDRVEAFRQEIEKRLFGSKE